MENKIAFVLLAAKCRTEKKMYELARNFDKKKKSCDLTSAAASDLMNDVERALSCGYKFLTYMDDEYPEELRHISYPPSYLFVRGDEKLLKYPLKVAIIGSRDATAYGMTTAANFAQELAGEGLAIVSGGARGIDTAAIRGAMRNCGRVIVVIGTGIDIDYPKENSELFEKVVKSGGAIISEFPMGMGPLGHNFPMRNRIMTGISDSVVVVEAAQRSGALISATHALEQGKTLFAVPGNIDSPNSFGVNSLLRDGALFALSSSDVLYDLMDNATEKFRKLAQCQEEEHEGTEKEKIEEKEISSVLSPFELAVVNAIKSGKDTYEEIMSFTMMDAKKLTSVLTIMEIKGIIKLAFRNKYKLND